LNEAFKLAPHEWALLRSLLDEALALPVAERASWLARLDDERALALKPRLQALLANAFDAADDRDPATAVRLLDTAPPSPGTGWPARRPGTAQPRRPGGAQAQDTVARWNDAPGDEPMSPLEFMQRLAALVPRPRLHLIRLVSA
jgi:hypothetical protein